MLQAQQIMTTRLWWSLLLRCAVIFCDRLRRSRDLCRSLRTRQLMLARPKSPGRQGTSGSARGRGREPTLFRTAQRQGCLDDGFSELVFLHEVLKAFVVTGLGGLKLFFTLEGTGCPTAGVFVWVVISGRSVHGVHQFHAFHCSRMREPRGSTTDCVLSITLQP